MTRILILTAGFGEGHNAAARHLAGAIERRSGPGGAPVVDLLAAASPVLSRLFRRFYYAAINGHPRIWRGVYAWTDRSRIPPRHLWLFRAELRALAALLAEHRPAAVCCTYPLYAFLLEHLTRTGANPAPIFNIVTDSISIHSMWVRPACAAWFVPNPDTAEVMRGLGVPADKIHAVGFPVSPFFGDHARDLAPPDLADGATPRVLYLIHSGVRHARSIARRLIEAGDWDITLAVGRDARLRRQLEQWTAGRPRPARVLGWTDQVPRLLMTHHVLVSKAGGATTQEAIAARCPLLVNQIVPGQEEGNYELLRRRHIGAYAPTPDAVVSALRTAFGDGGAIWRQWRAALSLLSRPDASRAIADRILALVAPGRRPGSGGKPTMDKKRLHVRTVIISDVHLGTPDCKVREVNHFLRHVRCEKLILNGDIIDGWQLRRSGNWTKAHTRFVRLVLKMLEKRDTRVVYLRGNHDDILAAFLPLEFENLQVVEDHLHEGVSGRYLVLHGDAFDSITRNFAFLSHLGDRGYNVLLRLNRLYNVWRAWRGQEYWSLSKAIKARVKSAVSHVSRFEDHIVQLARERRCIGVMCGHIHTPADKMIGDVHYLNSGDWVESLTAVVEHHDGRFELINYADFLREFPPPAEEPAVEAAAEA